MTYDPMGHFSPGSVYRLVIFRKSPYFSTQNNFHVEFAFDFFKDIEKREFLKKINLYISRLFRGKFVATPLNGKVSDRILSLEKPCFCC